MNLILQSGEEQQQTQLVDPEMVASPETGPSTAISSLLFYTKIQADITLWIYFESPSTQTLTSFSAYPKGEEVEE